MNRLTNKARKKQEIEDGINELLRLLSIAVYEKDRARCDELNIQIQAEIKKYESFGGN